jgi:hypothetical protein
MEVVGPVAHPCNPSYSGGGNRRIKVQGELGQNCETLSGKLKKKREDWCLAEVVKHLLA